MFATYNSPNPDANLRVRETPGGTVIDKIPNGSTVAVEVVERGWCKLDNGYADASFLTITAEPPAGFDPDDAEDSATAETGGSDTPETVGSDENATNDGVSEGNTELEGNGQTAEPPADEGNEADELRKMTNPKLYELAKNSGIKVKAGMNKDALIEAILAGADD